ncbi:alpha-2-macroglobulin family protein [Wenyingzhuangia sp. IMCC45574]
MKKSVFAKIACTLVFIFTTIGCKNEAKQQEVHNDPKFDYSTYVYNHTGGIKSVKSDINLTLAQTTNITAENLKNVLTFSPKIEGELQILNQKQLLFTPTESLKENSSYKVTVNLNKLFPNQDAKNYEFTFKTKKQAFEIKTNSLQSYNQDWQYITGVVKTNDLASLDNVKKVLTATQNGKNLSVKFDDINIATNTFLFKVDSIYREQDDSDIYLHYNGTPLGVDNKQQREIHIAGKNNFKLLDMQVVNGASQYVEINFSDPLAKNQNLKGLISIAGVSNVTYTVSGNAVKVYPKSSVLKGDYSVSVYRGVKNSYGYKFKETVTRYLSFDEPKPEVKFAKSGNILPNSQGLNVQFQAINLRAVDVTIYRIFESNVLQFLQQNNLSGDQNIKMVARPVVKKTIPLEPTDHVYSIWQTYGLALDKLINVEKGAIYKVRIDIRKNYATYECDNDFVSSNTPIETEESFDDEIETSNWDGTYNYYNEYNYYGNYSWRDRDNPCTDSYYRNKSISKNVLASDIGLLIKKGKENDYFIATNNLISSAPQTGVTITFYNYQQQPIKSVDTDENGIAAIRLKKTPFFVTAKKDGQTTYTKVNDGNVLSMSNFNTNGIEPIKGIKGYIYTERGVWRPGDTIFTAFMLNDLKNKLPDNHPVTLEVKDPNNSLKYRTVATDNVNNLYTFKIPTQDVDPTGTWTANISIGGARFSKNLKVETIKPNRLKININTKDEVLTKASSNVNISSKWLHGAIAKNLKVETDLMLKPTKTNFKSFPSFVFDDPSKSFETEETNVFKGTLDATGNTSFKLSAKLNNNAPGMLKAYLTTRVYENSGDFSTDVYPKTFSPFNSYVGLKRPQGDKRRNMLLTDKQHLFEVITVNAKGKPVANRNLEVKIYKMNRSWWWNNNNNYSQFSSATYNTPVFSKQINTKGNGKGSFTYELKYPEWGRYFVKVIDKNSGHSTGESVFIDWPGWAGKAKKGNQKEAAMLVFTTDKEKYEIGEQVTINFPSAEGGHALVTLENSKEVIKHFQVDTQKESTNFTFTVDKSMTPNIYISISSLQPHNNTANDLPIRMYGVKNIVVEDSATHLAPIVRAPKEVEPEKDFTIAVKETNGKACTYTLAIVDEGLLDLTRYKTPNPWYHFNAKEALGVKTWDMYDDVIGAFGGKLNQVFSIGGDMGLAAAKTQKANRFKPVVIYKGPFALESGATNQHKIKLPKYIGSVKAMVVAHHPENEAYGKADMAITVKKPLMLLASAPRKVSKGEKVKIPVTVFNSLTGKQNVNIRLQTNDVFEVQGNAIQSLQFTESGDEIAYFDLKVKKSGFGKINITASNQLANKASYDIELSAFNPINKVTKSTTITIDGKNTEKLVIDGFGIDDTNEGTIEISSFPQINFTDRLKYLIRYPHGCLEQTVSKAFPQLFISDLFEVNTDEKNKLHYNVNQAVNKLKNFQLLSGGFSYWPGNIKTNPWVSNYAGHFLIEAEKKGFLLPFHMKNNWISYQKDEARTWTRSYEHPDTEQAYRLYTLALAQNPELSMMNRLREDTDLSNMGKLQLALAYAIIGQQGAAKELMSQASTVNYTHAFQVNHGSSLINKSVAIQTYQALNENKKAIELLEDISKELNEDKYINTQTTAKCLLALANYYQQVKGAGLDVDVKVNGKKTAIETDKAIFQKNIALKKGANMLSIENDAKQTLYVKITHSGVPILNEEENISKNLVSTIRYKDMNGKTINILDLPQGTSFVAEIELKNTYNKKVKDIALTYQIPSGWEIVNTRYATGGNATESNADYVDIRDNRINYYFDLIKNESKKFSVKLNTTYLGSYYLPGVHAEAMYDNEFVSHTAGKWVVVKP